MLRRNSKKKWKKPNLSGKSVLLVEDNELNLEIAKMMLEDEKMVVTTAENGKEAVDIVSQSVPGRFDFIFMDIMMPVMDGLEAARQIRTLNRKDTKEIPIIAMTANAFQDDIRDCIDAGMNAHIAKPIDSKKIRGYFAIRFKTENAVEFVRGEERENTHETKNRNQHAALQSNDGTRLSGEFM